MRKVLLFMSKKVLFVIIAQVLFLSYFPIQAAFSAPWPFAVAEAPVAVDGRILPASKTGDISDWVEIARNGDYSLIVRKNFINIYPQQRNYGDPAWQVTAFGLTDAYENSFVEKFINAWFNGSAEGAADKLPWDIRLRDFTMQHNAKRAVGTCSTMAALVNGISKPTIYQVGIGDHIAFALSYAECANYLSKLRFLRNNFVNGVYIANEQSPQIAITNYNKINIPSGNVYSMWLRSRGDIIGKAGSLSNNDGSSGGRVFQTDVISDAAKERGLVYPALWVDSDIFKDDANRNKPRPGIPTVVDGRILTKEKAGDISDWIEIARSDGYSLIVRKNFLNVYSQARYYGDPLWQAISFGKTTSYQTSEVRKRINGWFNRTAFDAADMLPEDARLRDFTVQHNAKDLSGTCTPTALVDGLSRPSIYQVGVGDDIAFALSFGESANFISKLYFMRNTVEANYTSHEFAIKNYGKMSHPLPASSYATWLRSYGDTPGSMAALTFIDGRAFQLHLSGSSCNVLVYPALWVGSGIFEDKATIIVCHKDAVTDEILKEETHKVNPGNYGPYAAEVFQYYGAGYLANDSAPASGTIRVNETKTITYLYDFEAAQLTVTYHPNGGTGQTIKVEVKPNTYYTIQNQGYTKVGYTFNGWNTNADGTGMPYSNNQNIYMTTSVNLYAEWKPTPQLTVTYHSNDGTGQFNVVEVSPDTYYTIKSQGYTRPGYTFDGWNTKADGAGMPYSNNQTIYMTTSVSLYAQWKQIPKLTVNYYPNGGTGKDNTIEVNPNTYYTIQSQDYTRVGYTFEGWNTKSDGTGISYLNGNVIYMTASVNLHAQWKQIPKLTVNYYPNGGTGKDNTIEVNPNTYYTIQSQGYTRVGYTFEGWNTKSDGTGISYSNGNVIYMTDSVNLYAQWKQIPKLTVTYHPNGGVGPVNVIYVDQNSYYAIQDQGYTRKSYTQAGWNTREDGYGITYNNNQIIYMSTSITLYARWFPDF